MEIQVMAQCIRPGDVVLGRVVEKVRRTASAVHLYLKNEPEVRTVGPWATMTVWAGGQSWSAPSLMGGSSSPALS